MRKVVLSFAVSMDGFIEAPKGKYDWILMDQDYGLKEFFARIDTLFLGRKTYEFTSGLPGAEEHDPFSQCKKYVFSNTLSTVRPPFELIRKDVSKTVNEIKKRDGKDIYVFGGANLASSFLEAGLVDEISIAIQPIVLGAGKRLFENVSQRIHLKLKDSKIYSSGVVTLQYSLET